MTLETTNISGVRMVKENVTFYEDTRLLDKGKLTIAESSVDWNGENLQFSLLYQNICLHAVSRDPYGGDENVKFPHPHLFLMVEGERAWSNGEPITGMGDTNMEVDAGIEGSDNEEEETPDFPADEEKTSFVLRFVPDDQNALDGLYSAIAECQALNPDSEEFSEEDIGDVPEADEDEEENDDGENADEGAGVNGNEQIDPENFTNE